MSKDFQRKSGFIAAGLGLLLLSILFFGCVVEVSESVVTNVDVTPGNVGLVKGEQQQFTAKVTGRNNPSKNVRWKIEGTVTLGTTINSSGLLSVAVNETAASFIVTATSTGKPKLSGSAEVTVTSGTGSGCKCEDDCANCADPCACNPPPGESSVEISITNFSIDDKTPNIQGGTVSRTGNVYSQTKQLTVTGSFDEIIWLVDGVSAGITTANYTFSAAGRKLGGPYFVTVRVKIGTAWYTKTIEFTVAP